MKARACELCTGTAAIYCASDSAYLCWNCDARVHGANFLVARHLRRTICAECEGFDGNCISGVVIRPFTPVCRSCSSKYPEDDDADSISSSSACVSSTQSFATSKKKRDFNRRMVENTSSSLVTGITDEDSVPVIFPGETTSMRRKNSRVKRKTKSLMRSRAPAKVDGKTEGVLVNWCRTLGLNGNLIVRVASHTFGFCLTELTVLPSRVTLAASFWFSLRLCGDRAASTSYQNLKRLEEISGVAAKLIVAAQGQLARVLRDRKARRDDQEEGWAECSV